MTPKNLVCLWFDGDALDAAEFYARTFPDSRVGTIYRAPMDWPAGKAGDVLTVEFTVLGIPCMGLNGGSGVRHSEAFSFQLAARAARRHRRPGPRGRPARVRRHDDHAQDRHRRDRGRAPRVSPPRA